MREDQQVRVLQCISVHLLYAVCVKLRWTLLVHPSILNADGIASGLTSEQHCTSGLRVSATVD